MSSTMLSGDRPDGMVARPECEKLVAALCAGEVGAVVCFDALLLVTGVGAWIGT